MLFESLSASAKNWTTSSIVKVLDFSKNSLMKTKQRTPSDLCFLVLIEIKPSSESSQQSLISLFASTFYGSISEFEYAACIKYESISKKWIKNIIQESN